MRPMATLLKSATIAAISVLLFSATPAMAETIEDTPSAGAMVADAIFVRPLYFALSQAGAAIYTATLPFTLLGSNADQAAETLVITPLQGAFVRCLGCGKIENQVGQLSEVDGSKKIKHFLQLSGGSSMLKFNKDTEYTRAYGIHAGTHFSLNDGSRFDILLGADDLAALDITTGGVKFDDSLRSYQIISRFGRGYGNFDLMFHIGGHYYDLDRDVITSTAKTSDSYTGFGILGGVGVDTWFSENVRAGLQYTHFGASKLPDEYKSHFGAAKLNLSFMF